ncbi:MAG: methyltransferase domain-containing protein [Opitutaceae bacterium]|nr:methyltransferase domain-containing protein [Opitutaceae bacterium]
METHPFPHSALPAPEWWSRPGLQRDPAGDLWFAEHRVADLAACHGTPSYFYGGDRIAANVARLHGHLATVGRPARLLYAMKSNRFEPVLRFLHSLEVGLDVCSPGEIAWARACGFADRALSFTAGSLSTADYTALAQAPDVWVNADSLTALRRLAQVSPGRELGLRINPAAGLGYASNSLVRYSGAKPTKFGVYRDRFAEALALAGELGLRLTGLHCHAGCGFLTPQLPALDEVFGRIGDFLDAAPHINRLNLGGGLGIPLTAADAPLDLDAWAALVRRHFGQRQALQLEFEPGDYLVKDAGLLLTEVTQVEEKGGRTFVGVNAGFNVHPEPAFYQLPLEPAPVHRRPGPLQPVTIAGNVNEALDLWASDFPLPEVREGDTLAFLNAGGYGAAMASHHCLRHEMKEHWIPQRATLATPAPAPTPAALNEANKHAWDSLYASVPELVWGREPLPFLASYRDDFRLSLQSPSRLLDAGAGEGRNLPFLLSCGADETHAVDASLHALAKMPPAIGARVKARRADLGATGLPDSSIDGITLLDVVETLPDTAPVLRELYRILKPGGLLLCNIPGLDDGVAGIDMQTLGASSFLYRDRYFYEFHSPDQAAALLRSAGFEICRQAHTEWEEAAHPGYRPEDHRHVSLVFLVRRPPLAA